MLNIAEGFEVRTQILFKDYLGKAKASVGELRSQTYIAMDCGYINDIEISKLFVLCDKCSRQITRFMQYIARQPQSIRDEGMVYNV